ncbi:MAG: hypothetical protein WD512_20725 [Candidatus Paceibacterota bacterium]
MANGEVEFYTAYTLTNHFPAVVYKAIKEADFFNQISVKEEWIDYKKLIYEHLEQNSLI